MTGVRNMVETPAQSYTNPMLFKCVGRSAQVHAPEKKKRIGPPCECFSKGVDWDRRPSVAMMRKQGCSLLCM